MCYVERYVPVRWGCILSCFMASSLLVLLLFCCSAIPTYASYIFYVFTLVVVWEALWEDTIHIIRYRGGGGGTMICTKYVEVYSRLVTTTVVLTFALGHMHVRVRSHACT